MNDSLVEGIKEFLRTGIIAALPIIIDALMQSEINWHYVIIGVIVAFLRAADKLLHENDVKSPLDMTSLDGLKK